MRKLYGELDKRDTVVIAIAQEDEDLESHGKILQKIGGDMPFDVLADLERKGTPRYDRTTAYLIDKNKVVRQIFPMLIHSRPSWWAIVHQIDELQLSGSE